MATVPSPTSATVGQKITAGFWNSQVATPMSFWLSPPRCHAYQSSAQSITATTFTPVNLQTEEVDTDGIHSTVTNITRMTIVTPGRYRCIGQGTFAPSGTGGRYASLYRNGAQIAQNFCGAVASLNLPVQCTDEILCSAGDFIECQVWQNSGGALNLVAGSSSTFLHVAWVSTT